jgi:2'-5' RNA ligase
MSTTSQLEITDEFIGRLIGAADKQGEAAAHAFQTHITLASDAALNEVAAYSNQAHATLESDGALGEVAAYNVHVTFAEAGSHDEVPAYN